MDKSNLDKDKLMHFENQLHSKMMAARFDFAGAVVAAHASWNNFADGEEIVDELFQKVDELEQAYIDAYNDLMEFLHDQEHGEEFEFECIGTA